MDPANQNQQTGDNKSKKPENTGGEDWQSKFEGQRKVNRDLEKKLNEAYAKADKVDELEKQIAALQGKEAEYEAARKEQEPYLGKAEQAPSGANITPPSGTRDGDRHQGQLTRDDLKTMSPAEIVKAQQDGRLKDLLGAN